jgi:hypothetical protein
MIEELVLYSTSLPAYHQKMDIAISALCSSLMIHSTREMANSESEKLRNRNRICWTAMVGNQHITIS